MVRANLLYTPLPFFKDGNQTSIINFEDGKISSNSKLTFDYISLDDSGIYECRATNREGSISGKIILDVKNPFNIPPIVIGLIVAGKI